MTTRERIEAANSAMEEIVATWSERADPEQDLQDAWMPLADELVEGTPADWETAASMAEDYVGATEDGAIVCWGAQRGRYRPFEIAA